MKSCRLDSGMGFSLIEVVAAMAAGLVILGVALLLSNWLGVLLAMAFVPYMNRWQIGPEERALARTFGDSFTDYARRVRRWL